MLEVTTRAVYIGTNSGSFERDGEKIAYRKAKFSIRDSADTFSLSVDKSCDLDAAVPYEDLYLRIDFRYAEKSGIWNGRLMEVSNTPFDDALPF